MTHPFWSWYLEQKEAELAEIEKARRQIRRRGWKALKGGGAIRTDDPDDEIVVEVEKRAMPEERITKGEVSENMLAIAAARYPDAPTPQQALAMAVAERDTVIGRLWELHERARPDPIEVTKAADPTEASWQAIEARAQELMALHPTTMTHAQAVTRVLETQPGLYSNYRRAFDELAADVD